MNVCQFCNEPILVYNGNCEAPFVGLIEPSKDDFDKKLLLSDKKLLVLLSSTFYRHGLNLQNLVVFYPSQDHKQHEPDHWLVPFSVFFSKYPRKGIILFGSLKHSLGLSYPCALTLDKLVIYSMEIKTTVVTFPSPDVLFSAPGDLDVSIKRLKEVLSSDK